MEGENEVEKDKKDCFDDIGEEDGIGTFEKVAVKELVQSASDFFHKLQNCENQNVLELGQQLKKGKVPGTDAKANEAKLREVLQETCIKFFSCNDEEQENGSEASVISDGANDTRYSLGRWRSAPFVTENEVDDAIAQLTQEELESLNGEFDAQHNTGRKKADTKKKFSTVNNMADFATPTTLGRTEKNNDCSVMDFMRPDGKSICFGNNVVELTYQGNSWEYVGGDVGDYWANSGCGENVVEGPDTNTVEVYNTADNAPCAVSSPTHRSTSSSIEDSFEELRASFIRDRVRMTLLANHVAKDIEREFLKFLPGVLAEWESERNRALEKALKQQTELLEEAMGVINSVRMLKCKAMGEYVKDFCCKQAWQRDETVRNCQRCQRVFAYGVSHHHCRRCGFIFCNACSSYSGMLISAKNGARTDSTWLRICQECYEICCKFQRSASRRTSSPKRAYERERQAPDDPSLFLIPRLTHPDGTLEDNLPPFYVVLPEERYSLQGMAMSGLLNSLRYVPYSVLEGVQSAISSVSGMATQRVCGLITAVGESDK